MAKENQFGIICFLGIIEGENNLAMMLVFDANLKMFSRNKYNHLDIGHSEGKSGTPERKELKVFRTLQTIPKILIFSKYSLMRGVINLASCITK